MDHVAEQPKVTGRLVSLDALRGFDMFWIIGGQWIAGGVFHATKSPLAGRFVAQLRHVEWEGFHFIDLIMPLFLFIVGVAMPLSFAKRRARGDSNARIIIHVVIRVLILFVLGMAAQGNLLAYKWSKLHIYCNTLQAIAAGYLIASVFMLTMGLRAQIVTTAGLLLGYWALMMWVPVPGYGRGVLTEDGNLAIWLDKLILGQHQDRTPYTWILSSMVFGATTMLGVFAGKILTTSSPNLAASHRAAKVLWLAVLGVGCLLTGWGWGHWFPIIKHLWTSSFVLYSGGMCYLLMAVFFLLFDVWGFRRWAFFFVVIGSNAIAVYMATELYDFRQIADIFVTGLRAHLGAWNTLVRGVVGFAVIWLILLWMYRKKTFVKI